MNHRHLLPSEIDLLLDGEAGFGVAPLRGHIRECADCRARLEEGRALQDSLDHLPRFAPSPLFADRVMARVQVFQPWHVAAADSLRKLVPASPPARAVAGAFAGGALVVLSALTIWIAARFDLLLFLASDAMLARARSAVAGALARGIAQLFGQPLLDALLAAGPMGIAAGIAGILFLAAAATLGLRAAAAAAGRHRS